MKNREKIIEQIQVAIDALDEADRLTYYEGVHEPDWWLKMENATRKLREARKALLKKGDS